MLARAARYYLKQHAGSDAPVRSPGPRAANASERSPLSRRTAASRHVRGVANLQFQCGDAAALPFRAEFDIVTAARTLQWIANSALAIAQMKQAAKPGGLLVVLDYNHAANKWVPEPPPQFQRFYTAFLAWRQANGWDNEIADHLPGVFRSAGLIDVKSRSQDEITERGDADFAERAGLWSEVIESLGGQLAAAGFCTASRLKESQKFYDAWAQTALMKQSLAMRTVTGVVPLA